jgi:hypothetical protein
MLRIYFREGLGIDVIGISYRFSRLAFLKCPALALAATPCVFGATLLPSPPKPTRTGDLVALKQGEHVSLGDGALILARGEQHPAALAFGKVNLVIPEARGRGCD